MKKVRSKRIQDLLFHLRTVEIALGGGQNPTRAKARHAMRVLRSDIGGVRSVEAFATLRETLEAILNGADPDEVLGIDRTRGPNASKRNERYELALRVDALEQRGVARKNMDRELGREIRPDEISKLMKKFGPRIERRHKLIAMLKGDRPWPAGYLKIRKGGAVIAAAKLKSGLLSKSPSVSMSRER